jgi:hypothetical protein
MVDGPREIGDPAYDGVPLLQRLSGISFKNGYKMCARILHFWHSCDPNAFQCRDKGTDVVVVAALRKIEPGEEITISFVRWVDPSIPAGPKEARLQLLKWGIKCPPSCRCYDKDLKSRMARIKKLYALYQKKCNKPSTRVEALALWEMLFQLYTQADNCPVSICRLYDERFYLCTGSRDTFAKGLKAIKKCLQFYQKVEHPTSPNVVELTKILNNPASTMKRWIKNRCFSRS